MVKKNKHSTTKKAVIITIVVILILLLILLLIALGIYYAIKRKSNPDSDSSLYYFSFQKGDVWEEATFQRYDPSQGGSYVLFTSSEKKEIEQKLPLWRQKFPSIKNGEVLQLYSGITENMKLYVYPYQRQYTGSPCGGGTSQYCHHVFLISSRKPDLDVFSDGYFHLMSDPSFTKTQSVARDEWGPEHSPATYTNLPTNSINLISPTSYDTWNGHRDNPNCFENVNQCSDPQYQCDELKPPFTLFSLMNPFDCFLSQIYSFFNQNNYSFELEDSNMYKTSFVGKEVDTSSIQKNNHWCKWYMIPVSAVKDEDKQSCQEFIDFQRKINNTVICYNQYIAFASFQGESPQGVVNKSDHTLLHLLTMQKIEDTDTYYEITGRPKDADNDDYQPADLYYFTSIPQ